MRAVAKFLAGEHQHSVSTSWIGKLPYYHLWLSLELVRVAAAETAPIYCHGAEMMLLHQEAAITLTC